MSGLPAEQKRRPGFHDSSIRGLSISVLLFGCVCVGLGVSTLTISLTKICTIRYDEHVYDGGRTSAPYIGMCPFSYTFASPGIWAGLMFIASGIVGIMSAKRKTTCLIVTLMTTSITSAWFAAVSLAISILASVYDASHMPEYNDYPLSLFILNGCVNLFSLVCFILSLIKFGLACRAVCCNGSRGLPTMKSSGPTYQPLPATAYMRAPMPQPRSVQAPQGTAPVFQQNMAPPIYLVQGHQVIGMLPPGMHQQPAPVVYPAAAAPAGQMQQAVPSSAPASTDNVPSSVQMI